MTANYWTNRKVSSLYLLLIAVLSIVGVAAVELLQTSPDQTFVQEKMAAARLARQAMDTVKAERSKRGLPIDPLTDPTESGLIGGPASPVTSNNGHLPAKQTTVNPNFAAAVVQMLKDAGVQKGDTVAIGFSGSFPAMNLCTLAAVEALELQPVIVSSVAASEWGANHPDFLWIDMERALYQAGLFSHRSVAASIGGVEDQGVGMSREGLRLLAEGISRCELKRIDAANYLGSVNQRMAIYRQHAGGAPIRAYINVGGGTTSVGTSVGKHKFAPGLNLHRPLARLPVDSVMGRFADEGLPVIHLVHIKTLAARYGLPQQPTELVQAGEGGVYAPRTYNLWLAAAVLIGILAGCYFVVRSQPVVERAVPARQIRRRTSDVHTDDAIAAL